MPPKYKFKKIVKEPVKKRYKFKKKEPVGVQFGIHQKGKEPPTELMGMYGLTNKEANKMNPLELFGLLAPELKQIILDPKTTGVKVGQVSISKLGEDDLIHNNRHMQDDIEEQSNYFDAMGYRNDYTDFLSSKQNRFYNKHIIDYRDRSANERVADKMEALEEKLMEGVSNSVGKTRRKGMRAWKRKNKGMTGSLNALQKKFADFYEQF